MNSIQYEELCRYFLAECLGVEVDDIQSVRIPNPQRPGLPEYKHQIDLYWESEDDLALYLNIANAKWRSTDKVEQGEVLLLNQVKQDTGAHKAFMLTSTAFTSGAEAAAKDKGIGLHIVRPTVADHSLPQKDRVGIQQAFADAESATHEAIYLHDIIHKAHDFGGGRVVRAQPEQRSGGLPPPSAGSAGLSNKAMTGYSTKVAAPPSVKATWGGSSGSAPRGRGGSGGGRGVVTKQGGPGVRK